MEHKSDTLSNRLWSKLHVDVPKILSIKQNIVLINGQPSSNDVLYSTLIAQTFFFVIPSFCHLWIYQIWYMNVSLKYTCWVRYFCGHISKPLQTCNCHLIIMLIIWHIMYPWGKKCNTFSEYSVFCYRSTLQVVWEILLCRKSRSLKEFV